jgi:hypothetical protein
MHAANNTPKAHSRPVHLSPTITAVLCTNHNSLFEDAVRLSRACLNSDLRKTEAASPKLTDFVTAPIRFTKRLNTMRAPSTRPQGVTSKVPWTLRLRGLNSTGQRKSNVPQAGDARD